VSNPGTLATLRLPDDAAGILTSRHPWIYRDHLPESHRIPDGSWVRVEAGRAVAFGLYDAEGAIAIRLFDWDAQPDDAWWKAAVTAAVRRRDGVAAEGHTAYRLLFGEGDGLPGIVADRYGRFAVIEPYARSVEPFLPLVARTLLREVRLKGVVRRHGSELEVLAGEPPPPEETIRENGLRFLVNFTAGQKTGLFLDHREHRALVRDVSAGLRVLNLFAYTGGFSVHALAGGAREVWSVDTSAGALADAVRNVALNDLPAERHRVLDEDVFALLPHLEEAGERFDLVILDPPSLARKKAQRARAEAAYRRLNAAAARLVTPGGMLATASCTAQVPAKAFDAAVKAGLREAGRSASLRVKRGHAPDHPVRKRFPEGAYLKFRLLDLDCESPSA